MDQMICLLKARKEMLLKLKIELEKSIHCAPEGSLRISMGKNTPQFYLRTNPKDFSGSYIPAKNRDLARKLAQKDYDEKLLRSVEQELRAIEKYLSTLPKNSAEQIYETLHMERQKLITPIRETDQQFKEKWEQAPFHGKEIEDDVPPLYTEKGERVRSKTEVIIADILHREGIPYRYEYPLKLRGFGTVHPDFTVLNLRKRKVVYWEHLGMMDNPDYVETALLKIQVYKENGIEPGDNLILTWETRKTPIHQGTIRKEIDRYLR